MRAHVEHVQIHQGRVIARVLVAGKFLVYAVSDGMRAPSFTIDDLEQIVPVDPASNHGRMIVHSTNAALDEYAVAEAKRAAKKFLDQSVRTGGHSTKKEEQS